jgi:DNA-binding MarR family transcriptional regulator
MDKLEADGWVSRQPDPHDLRRVFADISPRGLETMRAWLKEWLEQASTDGDDRVTDLLNRIRGDKP